MLISHRRKGNERYKMTDFRGIIFPKGAARYVQETSAAIALPYYNGQHERTFSIPQNKIRKRSPVIFSDEAAGSLIETVGDNGGVIFILSRATLQEIFFPRCTSSLEEPPIPITREENAIKLNDELRRAAGIKHYQNLPPSDQFHYPVMSIRL